MKSGLKLAISGKGGVGKTTIASSLCHILARQGKQVFAIDADPDANLGMALGFPPQALQQVVTIAHDRQLIRERTGAEPGSAGQWFSLNPSVEDIPERYVVSQDGIRLLQMGAASAGGSGCACPENTLLKTLLNHLIVDEQDAVVVDMEAGLEHLGRGTAQSVDALLIVVEQGQRSLTTARTIVKLAKDLGIPRVYGIANKLVDTTLEVLQGQLGSELELVGAIPYTPAAVTCDFQGRRVVDACPALVSEVEQVLHRVQSRL